MSPNVNQMSIKEAARYYSSIGIVTHPLHGPHAKVNSPGKQPVLSKWQRLQKPFDEEEIDRKFSDEGNLGFICGEQSDLTVLDIDWHVKGIWENILAGVDTSGWVRQQHTENKYHFLFRYFGEVKAKTYQGLGFDILSNTELKDTGAGKPYKGGNNCVATPSMHQDGNRYQIIGDIEKRPIIPEIVIERINNLINTFKEITDKILPKCRGTFRQLFDAVFINKKHRLFHQTAIFMGDKENRDRHLHLCAELKANGANDLHLHLISMLIFGDRYDRATTDREIKYVEALPAKTKTILSDPILKSFHQPGDAGQKEDGKKTGKAAKVIIHFDEVADRILKENHIFSMRDNGQIYLYNGGVYKSEGTEAILGTQIRNVYSSMYAERWKEQNPDQELPNHIPKATAKFVNEVLAYIRAYTHITRDSIEEDQAKYINFKNCLFNLETWQIEDHDPDTRSICQIPVYYDERAECPKINDFLKSVVAEPDIDLLCEIAGYCLTTDCSFQKAFMLYGVGSNGKSVFLALLEALIGGDNTSAESLQKLEFDKYRTAKLYGKRVNICGDIPDSKMHKSEVFKKLTSGLDLIDGENKYQDSFVFRNTAKLVFSANVLPEGKKDKAYYRRWVLIQFPNNFEGGNEDRNLVNKLREPGELSGFLNMALEGLKRLKENGKFTNEKSIEDTQKEYEFNSNPVAAFMEECTQVSDEDCEATVLYLTYVDWCQRYGKPHMSNIGFSRKLNGMGYTSHRENVPGSYSSKKIPMWDNLKIRQDRIGQDKDKMQNGDFLSCPGLSDSGKTEIGQDANSFVDSHSVYSENESNNPVDVIECKSGKNDDNLKISLTRKDLSCPNLGFSGIGRHRTGYEDKIENILSYPVLEQKKLLSEEDDSIKNSSGCELLRTDLKNFARSRYNYVVEDIPVFVEKFNAKFPGYRKSLGDDTVMENAERLKTRGWS
jgi:P4 family phage/plasmid primase-like protien